MKARKPSQRKTKNDKVSLLPKTTLGILGGGQLAQMLSASALPMGLEVRIFGKDSRKDPARLFCHKFVEGDLTDSKAVAEFAQACDQITFESEFLPKSVAATLETTGVPCFPAVSLMNRFSHRQTQKETLDLFKIPTSPWLFVSDKNSLDQALLKMGTQSLLKKNFGGYDGYGTFEPSKIESLENLFPGTYILEKKIQFRRELAFAEVRSTEGEYVSLPLVESKPWNHKCFWVVGPEKHPQEISLRKKIRRMMAETNYVGILSVEVFDCGRELLVNELAPRVHNTGHYSMDAIFHSQFDLHLRAGLGLPLGPKPSSERSSSISSLKSKSINSFCMINLLARDTVSLHPPVSSLGRVHWYHKDLGGMGRKMGHINYIGKSKSSLLKLAQAEEEVWRLNAHRRK